MKQILIALHDQTLASMNLADAVTLFSGDKDLCRVAAIVKDKCENTLNELRQARERMKNEI